MNLILLYDNDFVSRNSVRLMGRRLKHILEVHQPAVGDTLTVGRLGGLIGKGRITAATSIAVEMEVALGKAPPAPLAINLVLALPRPKVIKRVLLSIASLGVKRLDLINGFRVEKSYWQSPALSPAGIRDALVLGLEQARDTILPEVVQHPLFKPFVEDKLPGLIRGTLALIAHPGAGDSCPHAAAQPVTLVIGPEGGFIPYELEKLVAGGCHPVQIGARILRVETAIPFILGRLCP
ncbi:MAG: 16S rRNA (uracil(1498)-N(3))-methyltransferase [Verrucomicrobia bacterium]|nr:16S rRNA (uracil(1498)-N(3))-methyltransferase [Verrucomicrobiota bacterium]MBU1734211.1 16S rRNA (uracil(1498)-N(3))-methyltransferase [Verrucomicrobiota bacterium]MBU1855749.1 16S rRNA (uracil(1498)-N(3))-methyltransferase [Verrucomicrobiota bacterium]